jgi:hypothetical protein
MWLHHAHFGAELTDKSASDAIPNRMLTWHTAPFTPAPGNMARTRQATAASRAQGGAPTLLSLQRPPQPLQSNILGGLPADARLHAAGVCRGWRAELADRSLWRELDLSGDSGVARVTPALLLAASARARGELRVLNLSHAPGEDFPFEVIMQCAADNAGALVELRVDHLCIGGWASLSARQAAALLAAAPRLERLYADMRSGVNDEPDDDEGNQSADDSSEPFADEELLCNTAPFGPLRIVVFVSSDMCPRWIRGTADEYAAHLTQMLSHASLTGLHIFELDVGDRHAALLPALVNHALCGRLTSLCVDAGYTNMTPAACLPFLTAILNRGVLRQLVLGGSHQPVVAGPHATAFCNATRHARLEEVKMINCCLLSDAPSVALLNTFVAHPTLRCLSMGGCARRRGLSFARSLHPDAPDARVHSAAWWPQTLRRFTSSNSTAVS